MSAKCRTERARRAVPDAFGDIADCQVLASQQILCDGHAPGEQVETKTIAVPIDYPARLEAVGVL